MEKVMVPIIIGLAAIIVILATIIVVLVKKMKRFVKVSDQIQYEKETTSAYLEKVNRELKENEDRLQLILNSTAEAVYGIDMEGNCTFCNDSCLKLLAYKEQSDLIGKNMHWMSHHSRTDGSPMPLEECQVFNAFMRGERIHVDDEVLWRSDGTSFHAEYFSYPQYKDGKIVGAVVTFMDITDRKKAEDDVLYLSYHDPLTGLYNRRFFEEELKRLDTERNLPISIIIGDLNGLKLTNDIFGHNYGDILLQKVAAVIKKVCREDDIIARWGGDEFIILLPKTRIEDAEDIKHRIKVRFSKERVKAIKGSISMGVEAKISIIQDIVQILEEAEDNMYLEKTLERKNNNSTMVDTIINTLHHNCPKVAEHSRRISSLCEQFGRAIHLDEVEIKRLKDAGFLHDIGKIALEDSLAKKEGPLTEQEWKEMKLHPVVGYRILNSFDNTLDLAEYVFAHHERWDGTGYPKGLRGEEIPKLARVIALAESYDAMTDRSNNPKALSREEAIEEIQQHAGTQFDPKLAARFTELLQNNTLV